MHHRREVPRQHYTLHAIGFTHDHGDRNIACGADLIVGFFDNLRMPFDAMDRLKQVNRFAIEDRIDTILAFQHGQFTTVARDAFAQADQHVLAGGGMRLGPKNQSNN